MTIATLLENLIPDHDVAICRVHPDATEEVVYAGDAADMPERYDAWVVCNFQAYCNILFIIV